MSTLNDFGHAGRLDVLALDDGLVGLDAAHDVVRLDREELLEDVGRAVGLQGPDLHLAEALPAELGLAAQWLLGDKAVRSGRAGVDLVLDEVVELEHVDVADGDLAVELLAGAAVVQDAPCPSAAGSALTSSSSIWASLAPSKTAVAAFKGRPSWRLLSWSAQPRCVSRIWPMFMRLGTPSGLRMMSTGVPSGR